MIILIDRPSATFYWEFTDVQEGLTQGKANGHVDSKGSNRGSADLCFCHKKGAMPSIVAIPVLGARVKEAYYFSCIWINPCKVRAFVEIAGHTCQGSVPMSVYPAMYLGDHMIELKREIVVFLRHTTILAAVIRPFANQFLGSSIHGSEGGVFLQPPAQLRFQNGQ
jgi:hypothetical protein